MLRVERHPGGVTVVSRLARLRVLAVLGGGLAVGAGASARVAPAVALALGVAALLIVVLGARPFRASFARGGVALRPGPLARTARHRLAAFSGAGVETFGEARRRRAERLARGYAERSGGELPAWLRPPEAPGVNDRLRRIVLVGTAGETVAVTSWLAEGEDLEPARAAIEAALR